jgi:hypothetical protein
MGAHITLHRKLNLAVAVAGSSQNSQAMLLRSRGLVMTSRSALPTATAAFANPQFADYCVTLSMWVCAVVGVIGTP